MPTDADATSVSRDNPREQWDTGGRHTSLPTVAGHHGPAGDVDILEHFGFTN